MHLFKKAGEQLVKAHGAQLGGLLEELTVAKARAGIEKLVHLTPRTARVLRGGAESVIPAEQVQVGDTLRVLPGECVPVAGVILKTGMNWLAVIVNLGALIGMTTVMLVQLYGQSRICYAMSRDGLFPKFFGHVHEKYRTPFKGTWFFGLLTAFAGGFININVLFELVNIGTLSAFIIVSAGILWMRKTQPNAPRGFRAPGVPVTPILAIVFCFVLIAGLNWETWVRFAIWFGLGLIVYFGYSRKRSKLGLEQKAGADTKVAATED